MGKGSGTANTALEKIAETRRQLEMKGMGRGKSCGNAINSANYNMKFCVCVCVCAACRRSVLNEFLNASSPSWRSPLFYWRSFRFRLSKPINCATMSVCSVRRVYVHGQKECFGYVFAQ